MITIDVRDSRPIYEQIIERVKTLVLKGVYQPDDPMPSVRSLAMELSINPNTIQRAYQELERMGYIYSLKGKGSFISSVDSLMAEQKIKLFEEFDNSVVKLKEAGISENELIEIIKERFDA